MASFRYRARDGSGTTVSGTISAKSKSDAIGELKKKNLQVVDVASTGTTKGEGKKNSFKSVARFFRSGVKKEEVVVFTRQLATMVGAGIPILEGLEIQREQAESPGFRDILANVVESVRGGSDFSKALA